MSSFRKDPFGQAWVLISPERGLEASDFGSVAGDDEGRRLADLGEVDGAELYDSRPSGSAHGDDWRVKVVRQPAALVEERPVTFAGSGPFRQAGNAGYQELVIEHPDPGQRLEIMPEDHLVEVLEVYRDRLALLGRRAGMRHVQLTRSVGRAAGARLRHPHAQLLAVPVPNRWLEEELTVARQHFEEHQTCLFCDVLSAELTARERLITVNDQFAAIAPYAAKHPFETWILPRRHPGAFAELPSNLLPDLAESIQTVLRAVNAALSDPPYNLILHTLPTADEAFHWHLEILPRLTNQAGFDWGSGFYVNPTPPEDAARFLREALAVQQVAR